MSVREKITGAIPWIEPILDYFDRRKQVVTFVAAAFVAGWSFVKDLPWPVIVVLAGVTVVHVAYALAFPAFLRLVNIGIKPRPNYSIWKHKKGFTVLQAAYLLADREPAGTTNINGDAAAWYEGLVEAVRKEEIRHVSSAFDKQHTNADGFTPQSWNQISAAELKKFCDARGRHPEFLT
jgi:hypothetical protein